MNKKKTSIVIGALFLAITLILFLPGMSFSGSLEPTPDAVDPSGNPVPTMQTLDEVLPSWSQKLPASERFVLVLDGTAVLDKETGLVWERSPWNYQGDWWGAQWQCRASCKGDRCGWRLPTHDELLSLSSHCDDYPWRLPCAHPFINLNYCYWSTTNWPFDSNKAYYFCPGTGHDSALKTTDVLANWCVRGGFGVD